MTDDRGGLQPGFEVALRGYRTAQVDAWVDEVQHVITSLETERDDARRLVASLQGSLDEMRAREAAPDTFGARAERILRMAEHDAHQRRERAESDAAEIRELGHAEAERTVAQARAEASRVHAEAARVRDDAERAAAHARVTLADARRDADLRVDTAASMNEHVQGLRGAIRGEVARLHAALGAELRALDAPLPADASGRRASPPVEPVSQPESRHVLQPSVDVASQPRPASPPAAGAVSRPATGPVPDSAPAAEAVDTATAARDTPDTADAAGPAEETAPEVVAVTDGAPDEPGAVVVTLPVQRDGSPTEDATPATGTPAATADRA